MKSRKVMPWIVVVLWMAVIFYLSAQPAADSNRLSKGVTEVVIEAVQKVVPGSELEGSDYNSLIRSHAHFASYLVLGGLVMNALSVGVGARTGTRAGAGTGIRMKCVLNAAVICMAYAFSDEIHQLFVPGRGAEVKDFLADAAGAVMGIGIYMGIRMMGRVRINR